MSIEEMISEVGDGASICLAPDYSGCSLASIREIIRQGRRNLHLIGCPQLGLQADLLIAAGCVASIETAAIGLGEAGRAPAFAKAYSEGRIEVFESTCPAIHSGLQAAEKGLPFMPVAGVIGSDLVGARPDWRIIDDPHGDAPLLTVPAIRPDFALFHVPLSDAEHAVWVGVRRELMLMSHASRASLVTTEALFEASLLRDRQLAPGCIPGIYIDRMAIAVGGARPCGLFGEYAADHLWIAAYVEAAAEPSDLARFIDGWLDDRAVA